MIYYQNSPISVTQAKSLSPLVLAFVGDAVQTLFTRTAICLSSDKINQMHLKTSGVVNAASQAHSARLLLEIMTDEEKDIYRRGRNTKSRTYPKSSSVSDYRAATGFEAVIGFLYLTGDFDRANMLLSEAAKQNNLT